MDLHLELTSSMMYYPTNISQIDLSYETTDTIEEFTVELQVQWWEALKGVGTNAGGEDIG